MATSNSLSIEECVQSVKSTTSTSAGSDSADKRRRISALTESSSSLSGDLSITTSLAPSTSRKTDAVVIKMTTYAPSTGVAGPLQSIPDDFAQSLQSKLKCHTDKAILLMVKSRTDQCVYFYGDKFQQVITIEITSQANDGVLEDDIDKIFHYGLNILLPNYCIFLKADLKDTSNGVSSGSQLTKMDVILPYPRNSKCIDSYLHIDVNRQF